MSSSGSGVGGDLGTPQTPTQTQWEQSAWTAHNRIALGIGDSIDSHHLTTTTTLRNRASAGQPLLDHPLEMSRMPGGEAKLPDNSWQPLYDELVNQLPDDPAGEGLKSQYLNQMQVPYEKRSGTFIALDNLLVATAKIVTNLQNASQTPDEYSPAGVRTANNLMSPYVQTANLLKHSPGMMQSMQEQINQLGPNNLHYDVLNSMQQQLQVGLTNLQTLSTLLQQEPGAETTNQYAQKLADQVSKMNSSVQGTYTGETMTFMKAAFQSLHYLTTALAIGDTSVPNLYLHLKAAMAPTNEESTNAFPGQGLNQSTAGLVNSLIQSTVPNLDASHQELLTTLTNAGMAAFAGFASQLADPGYGMFPNHGPGYLAEAREFSLDIALHMMNGLGVVPGFFAAALESAGVTGQPAEQMGTVLSSVTTLMMILSGTQGMSESSLERIMDSHQSELASGLTVADGLFNSNNGEFGDPAQQDASIALQQAQNELEGGRYTEFLQALSPLLGLAGTSEQEVQGDLSQVQQIANAAVESVSAGPDDSNAQIISVV